MSMRAIIMALSVFAFTAGLVIAYRQHVGRAQAAPPAATPAPAAMSSGIAAPSTARVIAVTTVSELDRLLASHPGRAVLDFHADWCKPCKELLPKLAVIAQEHPEILVISIDVLAAEVLSKRFDAENLPLLVRIDHGVETARQDRVPSDAEFAAWLGLTPAAPVR